MTYYSSQDYNFIKDSGRSKSFQDSNIVILPGGADISPTLYNSKNVACGFINEKNDLIQWALLKEAHKNNKFVIGICRGAQMITAYNGGKLIQDISGHYKMHSITFTDGSKCMITSCHHQMCYPFNLPSDKYDILAYSTKKLSNHYTSDGLAIPPIEPEVIWYPETRMLAIQGHPEWMSNTSQFIKIINNIIEKLQK